MPTVLEVYTTEKRAKKESMQRIFKNKCFLFTVGSISRMKRFTTECRRFADDEEVETEMRKWLRQQSKYFYAAGFDALVSDETSASMLIEYMPRNIYFSQVRI
jgi:hypothetical protein